MSKVSNAVKDRWNSKTYDDLRIRVPKGRKDEIEARVKAEGISINALVNRMLRQYMEMDEAEWKNKE